MNEIWINYGDRYVGNAAVYGISRSEKGGLEWNSKEVVDTTY